MTSHSDRFQPNLSKHQRLEVEKKSHQGCFNELQIGKQRQMSLVRPSCAVNARLFRTGWLPMAGLGLITTCVFTEAIAQDPFGEDPIGAGVGAVQVQNNTSTRSPIDPNETNAVVRSLRANPPSTAKELGKAIDWMTRIRRWDETGYWLDTIGKMELNGPIAIEILQSAGARAWSSIERNSNAFQPSQLQLIGKLRKLADDEIHSPATLEKHVIRLTSPDQSERLKGYDGLRAAGNAGVAAMLNAVMRPNGLVPTPSMVEAFSLLGPQATRAWQAAMTAQNPEARERLIQLVERAPQPDMGPELLTALHDTSIKAKVRQGITDALIARGKPIPTPTQSYEYGVSTLHRSLDQYRQLLKLNDVQTQTAWDLTQDGLGVQVADANAAEIALTRAAQAAIVTLRAEASSDTVSAKALAAVMEKLSRGGNEDLTKASVFQTLLPESLRDSHEFACLIWDAAKENSLRGAQALAASNLARWQGKLLPNPVRERLVAACESGDPHIRYPAAIALMNTMIDQRAVLTNAPSENTSDEVLANIRPSQTLSSQSSEESINPGTLNTVSTVSSTTSRVTTQTENRDLQSDSALPLGFQGSSFHGASRVDFVGREMQRLMAEPMVMIVGASPSLRSHMHQLVDQMGFRYFEASSVDDVFSAMRNATPIEAIVILDHLRDMDLGQLVQRVRANPSTSTVPIALLADSLSSLEHSVAMNDPGVIVGAVPPSLEAFGDIVHRMDNILAFPRATPEDRVRWKENAANYFRQRDPQGPTLDPSNVSIRLADTQADQQNLLRIAADPELPAKRREQASQIFVQSVQRFGLLISTDMINAQYDVYNTRGETEPVTRLVVGKILDAIDAEYGRGSSNAP